MENKPEVDTSIKNPYYFSEEFSITVLTNNFKFINKLTSDQQSIYVIKLYSYYKNVLQFTTNFDFTPYLQILNNMLEKNDGKLVDPKLFMDKVISYDNRIKNNLIV